MIKLPATLMGATRRMDKSIALRFETQELSTEAFADIDTLHQVYGWLVFKESEIQDEDIPTETPTDETKTPSQRLRAVLFVWWQQSRSELPFDVFYRNKMEVLIETVKKKLD